MARLWMPQATGTTTVHLQAKRKALIAKQPQRATGRHIFLQDMLKTMAGEVLEGQPVSQSPRRAAFAKHAGLYHQLSQAARTAYERAATQQIARTTTKIADDLGVLEADLNLRGRPLNDDLFKAGVMTRCGSCHVKPEGFDTLARLWQSNAFMGSELKRLRELAEQDTR